jgi:hypothetical protein
VCHHRPHGTRILVGQRYGGNILMPSVQQLSQPDVGVPRLQLSYPDRGARSVDKQSAQIRIAALTYTQQRGFATARVLPRN